MPRDLESGAGRCLCSLLLRYTPEEKQHNEKRAVMASEANMAMMQKPYEATARRDYWRIPWREEPGRLQSMGS